MLIDTVAAPLVGLGQAALGAIPNLLTLIVIFIITRYLLQVLRLVFQNIQKGIIKLEGFDRKWAWPTYRIVNVVVIIIAVVVAYPYIPGSGTEAFKGISILLGVLMSLGANSVASNLLGGFVVIYKRSINTGDLIKVGDITGYVEHIALLDTELRSLKNELVSIPNSVLTGDQIINYTRTAGTTGLLLHTAVGIGYEEPRQKVERLLVEAAVATAGVKEKPRPFVLRTALGSHDVTYEINAYMLKDFKPVNVYSELHAHILDRFNSAGVQIMTPFYVGDPAEPKIAPAGEDSAKSRRIPDREGA
jgi:small-conductance mechanosensitive channel